MTSFSHCPPYSRPVVRLARWWMSPLLGIIAVGTLSACGKSEKIQTTAERLSSVQQKQETQPDFYLPRKRVDYLKDMKSLDAPARPEPASKAEPKAVELRADTKMAAAPAPAPAPVITQPAPAPAPAATAPASNVVASSAPTARPPAPRTDAVPIVSIVSREQPNFPRDALRAGIENGNVRARLTINAAGDVTNVAILQSQPVRVFDRTVQQALVRWKFNPGTDGRTFETEIAFKAN